MSGRDGTASDTSAGQPRPTAREWLARFAAELGVDVPNERQFTALLDLAAVAAHASERVAAPVACWLCGVRGIDPEEAARAARRVSS